jgi:outer membrane protein OmpA-like peptidoglycan-associated protein
MSDTNYRNRVTVYYLLAEHFGKLGLFGAAAPGAAATAAPVVPIAAAATLAAAAAPAAAHAMSSPQRRKSDNGFLGFAALVGGGLAAIMLIAAIAGSYAAGRFDAEPPAPPAPAVVAAPAIPEGAGIVSEVIEGRPKVSVYFAVDEFAIAPEFAAAVAPVREWLAAHPDDRVQLSGFTDPTGDAAANAVLAKNRAEAVAAELTKEGVDSARIDLVKPEDTSDESTDLAGARRVEITVTGG